MQKDASVVLTDKDAVKQDQINMLFSGTSVTIGRGVGVVVGTGINTAIGAIHTSISETGEEKTPLKIALDEFGDSLARIISLVCIAVWVINIGHFSDPAFNGILEII